MEISEASQSEKNQETRYTRNGKIAVCVIVALAALFFIGVNRWGYKAPNNDEMNNNETDIENEINRPEIPTFTLNEDNDSIIKNYFGGNWIQKKK